MRTVKQLPDGTPIETDLDLFPDSNIINETDAAPGTPVVREVYGDILQNLYKTMRLTRVIANGSEDNEDEGFQLVEAFQKLANVQNDVEQQLNLSGTVFSINLDLRILPDKYFCFCRSVEDYVVGPDYTFQGSDANPLGFTSPGGWKSGDVILLIIDHFNVRAYSINHSAGNGSDAQFTVFGTPLAFNDSNKLWYQSEGILFSDLPEAYDLQAAIRAAAGDGTLLVYEMLVIQGFVLCLVFAPGTLQYKFYRFAINDLSTPLAVTLGGTDFPTGTITDDFKPNVYTDGTTLYITNGVDNNANDYNVYEFAINMTAGTLVNSAAINLDHSFEKTTNAVIVGSHLYTFIGGVIQQYNLSTGAKVSGITIPGNIGVIFKLNGAVYYSNGEVGKVWTLPVYS